MKEKETREEKKSDTSTCSSIDKRISHDTTFIVLLTLWNRWILYSEFSIRNSLNRLSAYCGIKSLMIFENSANKSNIEINKMRRKKTKTRRRRRKWYSAVQRKLIYNLSIEIWSQVAQLIPSIPRTFDKNQRNVVDGTQLSQFH